MRLITRGLGLAAVLFALVIAAGCMHFHGHHGAAPATLDYATSRLSENGAFRVSYRSEATPIPMHRLHRWIVRVETADGQPLSDATLGVDGDMPGHGHGMPTRPTVSPAGENGEFVVDGMKFQMGGLWVVEVAVRSAGRSDVARFNLNL